MDAIPQSIREIGRLRAGGHAAKGAYGVALSDIGTLAASIPAQMQQQQQLEAQTQVRQQQMEMGALELADKKRAMAADEALSQAMAQALSADGMIDPQKLTQHLAGTPAASKLPEILQRLNQFQKSSIDLRVSQSAADEADRDEMGSLAAAADAAGEDPETQAGVILTGIASRVKRSKMTAEEANPIIAGLLGDDGSPDPAKVKSTLAKMKAASKEQRQLSATDAAREAQTEDAISRRADRTEVTAQRKLVDGLTNYSRQLGATTDQARYARVYQGIPETLKGYFDPPDAWSPESARHASEVLLSPDQRADNARQAETARQTAADRTADNARQDTAAAETRRHNLKTEETSAERERRLKASGGAGSGNEDGVYSTTSKRGYDAFVENYEKRYPPKPKEKAPDATGFTPAPVSQAGDIDLPADRPPPPSLEKWYWMSDRERQAVIANPNARITDAELLRRQETGDVEPQPTAQSPQPQTSAKPGAGKVVTIAQVRGFAKQAGISEDAAREQAIREGYAVVK